MEPLNNFLLLVAFLPYKCSNILLEVNIYSDQYFWFLSAAPKYLYIFSTSFFSPKRSPYGGLAITQPASFFTTESFLDQYQNRIALIPSHSQLLLQLYFFLHQLTLLASMAIFQNQNFY